MKDMEQVLLSNTSLDELIKMKIEEEFKPSAKNQSIKPEKKVINDVKNVPKEFIFSKKSVFKVYNRKNKSETVINGVQADALIGIQTGIREKFLDGSLSAFSTEDAFVKFEKVIL